jgi:ribonuclease T2
MRKRRTLTLISLIVLLGIAALVQRRLPETDTRPARAATAGHDYYVMALSWSPTFCRTHPEEQEQCGRKGYGFVLHGLWPQYERGGGPLDCSSSARPDSHTVAEALAFMPSRRLIHHEWRAHGSCSGLAPRDYFELAERAFTSLQVPLQLKAPQRDIEWRADELRRALRDANRGLRDDMLSLHCSQGDLVEVRVCLDKDLTLRGCGKRMRTGCPVSQPFTIPAVRQAQSRH